MEITISISDDEIIECAKNKLGEIIAGNIYDRWYLKSTYFRKDSEKVLKEVVKEQMIKDSDELMEIVVAIAAKSIESRGIRKLLEDINK